MLLLVVASCHSDSEDYFTTARINLTLPVAGEVELIQYSVSMMNLNSRDVVTEAGKTTHEITVGDILRGAYSINVEGVVKYIDAVSEAQVHQFRAQSQYVSIVDEDNTVDLEMIFMD